MTIEFLKVPENPSFTITETCNGPGLWEEILWQMAPTAVIAGGAIRDWFLGVPPKDIDVFMPVWSAPGHREFESLDGDKRHPESIRAIEYAAMGPVELVLRAHVGDWTVDAVGMDKANERFSIEWLMTEFDFGITRSAYQIGRGLIDTPEARKDRQNHTVTMLRDDRLERAEQRFHRFNTRMGGDWEFIR